MGFRRSCVEEMRPFQRKCRLSGWPLAPIGILDPGTAVCHLPNHNLGAGDRRRPQLLSTPWGCPSLPDRPPLPWLFTSTEWDDGAFPPLRKECFCQDLRKGKPLWLLQMPPWLLLCALMLVLPPLLPVPGRAPKGGTYERWAFP